MKLNLDQALLDPIGRPIPDGEDPVMASIQEFIQKFGKSGKPPTNDEIIEHIKGALGAVGNPITLGGIVAQALLAQYPNDQTSGAEKHRRYKLWFAVKAGGLQDLTAEDIAMIKDLIGKGWAPLIVGQCWEMLEGRDVGGEDQTASDRMMSHQA